jgi:hypothetical protein
VVEDHARRAVAHRARVRHAVPVAARGGTVHPGAWLERYPSPGTMRGSGGLAYVIRDGAHPVPARDGVTNW